VLRCLSLSPRRGKVTKQKNRRISKQLELLRSVRSLKAKVLGSIHALKAKVLEVKEAD
jgi:hypothetical protein